MIATPNRARRSARPANPALRRGPSSGDTTRLATAALAAMLLVLGPLPGPLPWTGSAAAQEDPGGASYLTPFPPNDVYQVLVIGDTFAEGILYGLVEAMGADQRLLIQRKHRTVSGLMTNEYGEHMRQLEDAIAREAPHVAVVMLGEDDRQPLRNPAGGRRIPVGAEEWRAEYGRRVDRLMKALKKRGTAVYWVGLPNLRRSDANDDAQMMNDLIRERGYMNGIKYIDAFAGFSDEGGAYSAYGPDLTGKIRLLREGDGINFTAAGNRKLAHFVERELKRDLGQAKAERTIPLAGAPAEQEKINKEQREAAARLAAQALAERARQGQAARQTAGAMATAAAQAGQDGEQKADNGRINLRSVNASGREEVIQLEIVRPAIPASVVALLTRRDTGDKPSPMGETLLDQIAGGTTVMSSVTPAGTSGQVGARSRLSPTQTPYFRVMVKGERIAPQPGRADDMRWPRPEAKSEAAAAAGQGGTAPANATPAAGAAAPPAGKDAARDAARAGSGPRAATPRDGTRATLPRP